MAIKPEQLTVAHLRAHARILAVAGDEAIEVRPNRRLPPFVHRDTPAPVQPPDLEVEVPVLDEANVASLRERIRKLQEELNAAGGRT